MPKAKETTRGIRIRIKITGDAEVDLADIVGDRPLEGVDQEAARKKAEDALEGAELHGIELDGLNFVIGRGLSPLLLVGLGGVALMFGIYAERKEVREAYEKWWHEGKHDALDHRAAWTAAIAWQKNRPGTLRAARCRSALETAYRKISRNLAAELRQRHPQIPPIAGACAVYATLQRELPEIHRAYHYNPKEQA